jgi:hypothetical protein
MDFAQPLRATTIHSRRRTRRMSRFLRLVVGVLLGVMIIGALPVLASLGAYAYLDVLDIIFPGVEIDGVSLEGLAMHEAVAKLDRIYNDDAEIAVIDTLDSDRTWTIPPSEFGLSVDSQAMAAQAHAVGRNDGLVAGVEQMLADEWTGAPIVAFDPEVASDALEKWANVVNIPYVEADLAIESGQVLQTPGSVGKHLDIEASLELITSDPAQVLLGYHFIPLVMVSEEPMIMDVSEPARKAEAYLSSGLTLRAYDPVTDEHFTWKPSRERIASWLEVQRGPLHFRVSLDEEAVAEYVAGLNDQFGDERSFDYEAVLSNALAGLDGVPSETAIIHYEPREYVVQQTQSLISFSFGMGIPYWKVQELNPQLYWRGVIAGETITLPPKDVMLPLPVVPNKRILISITEQHMWVYQDGEEINDYVVSTGMAGSPTMAGIFQVQSHFINAYASRWDLWMPNFLGIYEAAPGFLNGIHGLPLLSNGVRLWGSVLGQPASYGCIILDLESAEYLYEWAEDGVVVEIME